MKLGNPKFNTDKPIDSIGNIKLNRGLCLMQLEQCRTHRLKLLELEKLHQGNKNGSIYLFIKIP